MVTSKSIKQLLKILSSHKFGLIAPSFTAAELKEKTGELKMYNFIAIYIYVST
jgi:hypothetical protein